MNNPEKTLENQCNRIRKHMRILIQAVEELENTTDDEAAYNIIHEIRVLYASIDQVWQAELSAGDNEYGEPVLDAYEATAQAIREARD